MELAGNESLCRECWTERYAEVTTGSKWTWRDDLRELRLTPVTDLLAATNVAIFLAMAVSSRTIQPSVSQLLAWGADFAPLTLNGQWWRLVSSGFLHANEWHLYFNMLGLLALGSIVERGYGKVALVGVYGATMFAASANSMLWHHATVTLGASGAIFGLLGFLIPPLATGELSLKAKRLRNPAKAFMLAALYNLVIGALVPFIDNSAHIGGLVAGVGIGIGFALFGRRVAVELKG